MSGQIYHPQKGNSMQQSQSNTMDQLNAIWLQHQQLLELCQAARSHQQKINRSRRRGKSFRANSYQLPKQTLQALSPSQSRSSPVQVAAFLMSSKNSQSSPAQVPDGAAPQLIIRCHSDMTNVQYVPRQEPLSSYRPPTLSIPNSMFRPEKILSHLRKFQCPPRQPLVQ